jgi:predicted ATPase
VRSAVALAGSTGEAWYDAELHRLEGELLLHSSPDEAGEAAEKFLKALKIARSQGAGTWELRAGLSLARLKRSLGKREDARTLLEPLLTKLEPDSNLIDLDEARRMLAN